MADYPYAGILVADAATFRRATNAAVTVYDVNDTNSTTPLALKDLTGLPLPNPLTSTSDGFVQAFVTTAEGVKLVGGGLTVVEYSHQGIKDAAVAAAAAAAAAASAASEASAGAAAGAASALAGAVTDAQSAAAAAAASAALVGAPADSAIAAAVNGSGTATKAALSATYEKVKTIDVTAPKYGAKGDGTTDDTAAIAAAIADLASTGGVLTAPPGRVFKTTSNLSITGKSHLIIDFNGSQILNTTTAGSDILTVQGAFTPDTTYASAAIAARASTITVNSVSGLAAGDVILIRSSGELFNPDRPTQDYKGELARIASIAGNVLTLESETWDSYSVTGFTVNVGKVTPVANVSIRNLRIKGGGTGLTQTAVQVKYFEGLRIDNVHVDSTETYGVLSNTGYNQVVTRSSAVNCDQDSLGYGFLANGVDGLVFSNCKGRKNRHSFDLSDQNTALVRNALITECLAEDDKSAGISTHCCDQVVISHNIVRDCGGGIVNRGKRVSIIDNKIYGSKSANQSSQSYINGIVLGDNAANWGAGIGATDLIIRGNLIDIANPLWGPDASNSIGIYSTAGLKNARIIGNTIRGFSAHGIYAKGDVNDNVLIEDNDIDCTSQIGTVGVDYAYGVFIAPGHNTVAANVTTGLRVRRNRIKGAIRTAVYVQGGNTAGVVSDDIQIANNDISNYGTYAVDFHAGYFGGQQLIERNRLTGTVTTPTLSNVLDYGSTSSHVRLPRLGLNDIGATLVTPLQHGQQMGAILRSGFWYGPIGSSSGAALADGAMWAVPFFVSRRVTLNGIGVNVTTAGITGTKVRLGIYADIADGIGGYPGALVGDYGQVAADAVAYVSTAAASTLEPGLYWFSAVAQGGAPTVSGVGGQTEMVGTTATATVANKSGYRQTGIAAALPATFTTSVDAQGGAPLVQVKIA